MNTANKARALTAPASLTRLARKENARGEASTKRSAGADAITHTSRVDAHWMGTRPLSLQGKAPQP